MGISINRKQTPAELLADLKTVDGNSSGLDADLLRNLSPDVLAKLNAPIINTDTTVSTSKTTGAIVTPGGGGFGKVINAPGVSFDDGLNVFSAYEEGTWTPQFGSGGVSVGTTVYRDGLDPIWRRINDLVFISGFIKLSVKGSSTGQLQILGLPFVSKTYDVIPVGHWLNMGIGLTYLSLLTQSNASYLTLRYTTTAQTGTTTAQNYNTMLTTDSTFVFSGWYQI